MATASNKNSRRWCFTLFDGYANPGSALLAALKLKVGEDLPFVKAVWQEEECPDSKKLHIQGFLVCKNSSKRVTVKSLIGSSSVHLESSRGSDLENYAYCTKMETRTGKFIFEYGDFIKGQGRRSDLDKVRDLFKDGKSFEDIVENNFATLVKYHKGLQFAKSLFSSKECGDQFWRRVIVLWGRTGSGKSCWARQFCSHFGYSIYNKPPGRDSGPQWFDGYDGEDVLLLDDFEGNQVPFRELLVWLDVYKHRVQIKGGMIVARWHTVIITSNIAPGNWYSDHMGALARRLDNVFEAPTQEVTGGNVKEVFFADKFAVDMVLKCRHPKVNIPMLAVNDYCNPTTPVLTPVLPSPPPLVRHDAFHFASQRSICDVDWKSFHEENYDDFNNFELK